MFTDKKVQEHLLEDYIEVKNNFKGIPKLTHIKYVKHDNNKLYTGNLILAQDDYIVLRSQDKQWSINKNAAVFYYKKSLNREKIEQKIENLDEIINVYNSAINKKTVEEASFEDDFLDKLLGNIKPKVITKEFIKEIKDTFPELKKDKYVDDITVLRTGDIVRVVDKKLVFMRTSAIVKDIIKDNNLITHLVLLNNTYEPITYKIKVSMYYIFLVPVRQKEKQYKFGNFIVVKKD